jgi:hypothetical protein
VFVNASAGGSYACGEKTGARPLGFWKRLGIGRFQRLSFREISGTIGRLNEDLLTAPRGFFSETR